MAKLYTLATTDKPTFDRLVEACAGLGKFQMEVMDTGPGVSRPMVVPKGTEYVEGGPSNPRPAA